MPNLHGYTIKGASRIKIIMLICVISYIIYIVLRYYLNDVINIEQFNHGYITIPITFSCIFGLLFMIFDKYLWKCYIVNRLLKTPNISGRWKCIGESFKKSSSELQEKGVINIEPQYNWEADINIIQTWTNICIILNTKQSGSKSFMAQIEAIDKNYCQLTYAYTNITSAGADTDMRNHEGICRICFTENITNANGEYFTNPKDRLSYGKMKWTKV